MTKVDRILLMALIFLMLVSLVLSVTAPPEKGECTEWFSDTEGLMTCTARAEAEVKD